MHIARQARAPDAGLQVRGMSVRVEPSQETFWWSCCRDCKETFFDPTEVEHDDHGFVVCAECMAKRQEAA